MIWVRRFLRILKYTVLVVLAFVVGALAVLTLTGKGRENLAAMISDFASSPDRKIRITGIDGIWSGNLSLDQLVLEDSEGPWLAVRGIKVDWSPTSLLWLKFDAEKVAAERVEFARLPKPSTQPPAEGGSGSLPVDVSIGALDFPDIALGQPVTGGQVASIAAKGKAMAQASPLTVNADLTVSRTDGTAGEVLAAIDFAPQDNKLDIDLKASEPSGGILANLLGLPGKPAVDIIVTGSGPLANWKGNGTFAVDGNLITTVSATHRQTDAGNVVEAKGDGVFDRFLPERFRPLLAGKADFDLAGTLTKAGGVEIARARIDSTALGVTATGSYDPQGLTDIALELAAKNNGVPLSFGAAQSPIDIVIGSATVRALGDGRKPGLDIAARLPSVSTNDVRLADLGITLHSDEFDIATRSGPVTGAATAASLTIDNPTVAPLVAGEIRAGLEGVLSAEALKISKGTLRSDAIDGNFGGDVSLADGSITLKLGADVVSAALPAGARPVLGDKVALSADIARDTSGNVSANSLSVQSGGLSAAGSASLKDGAVEADLAGALADVSPLAPQASGAVAISAKATGSLAAPDIALSVKSDRLAFGERALEGLDVTIASKVDLANPQAAIAIKGNFQGQPLDGNATLALASGSRQVNDLSLALGTNRVTGSLILNDAFLPVGTLDFDLADLGGLAALGGQSVQGAARSSATFSIQGDRPQVKVALASDSIKRDAVDIRSVAIDALVADYLKTPAISGTVAATVADILPGQKSAEIKAAVSGTVADTSVDGTISADGSVLTSFQANHRLTDAGSVVTAKGDGDFAGFAPEQLRRVLAGTTSFDVAASLLKAGGIRIDRAQLGNAALAAQATGTYDPAGAMDATLRVTPATAGASLSFGTPASPIDVTLDALTVHASGDSKAPKLEVGATLPSIATKDVTLRQLALALQSERFEIATRSGPLIGSVTADGLTVDNPTVAPLVAGQIRAAVEATMAGDMLTISNGTLRSDAFGGSFGGAVSLAGGPTTVGIKADVRSTALPQAARPALGDHVLLSASIERDVAGAISAKDISVTSGPLTASGSARIAEQNIEADLSAALADIASFGPQASGAVALTATARGALAAPEFDVNVTSDRLAFSGQAIEGFSLQATGKADAANPQADLALKGTFQGETLAGKAEVVSADGKKEVREIDFSLGPNRISGQLSLDDAFVPTGSVKFDLPELARLAALAGQSLEGAAAGSATFANEGGTPQARIMLASDEIRREAIIVSKLGIDVSVTDYLKAPSASGTVGATLADLVPGQPPADVRVALQGTLGATTGEGTVSMEGKPVTSFTVAHRMTDAGSQIEAKGDGEFSRFVPEGARQFIGGKTNFDVAALLPKGGPITIDHADVSNGALTAKAKGTYDPAGAVDLSVQVGAGQSGLPLSFGTDEAPIDITIGSATARVSGPIAEPKLDIGANLSKVATNDVQLVDLGITLHSEKFNIASRAGPFTGAASAARLVISNPTVAPLVAGEVKAQLEGLLETDALTVSTGILRSDAIDGGFNGKVSLKDGSITLKLKAEVVSAALPAAIRPILGPKLALSTDLERDTEGNVSANSLALQSGGVTGSGVIKLSHGQIDADVKGALADISPLAQQASGSVTFSATAKGALATPDVALSVTSDKMRVADRDIEKLALNASGKADLANPQASVTISGKVAGETLDGKAVLKSTGGRSEVSDLNLSLGKNRIAGALTLDQNFVPDGSIDFDLPDIGPLAALALETVEGSVKGKASFTHQGQAAQATVSLKSDSITRGDIVVRAVAVDAQITNYMVSPGVSGTVKAQEVRAGTTAVRGIDLKLSREDLWTRFSGGASVNDIPLKAAGRVKVENGTTIVELASAEATMRGIKAALARASTVSIAGGQTKLGNLALNVGGGSVTVSGTAGSSLDANVAIDRLPASVVNAFAPGLDAGGTISGTVKATGAAANPAVAYTLDWSGAQTSQTRGAGLGGMTLRSTGNFASQRLTFQANMSEGSGLALKGGGTVAMDAPPRLDLKFDGGVPFGFLAEKLAAQGLSLTGTANVNLTVTGAATAPVLGGSVRTSGARLVDARSGIAVNEITADIALGGGRATISRMSGKLSSGGSVSASGTVRIDPARGFPGDIAVKLTDARYTDGEVVTTTASGGLTVKGPLASAPVIGGTVNLSRTVISIPQRLPSSLTALDVQHKNAPAAVKKQNQALFPPQASGGGGSGGLALDLTINAPQRIFVQGRGLDAELGGSLKLVGPVSAPRATGQFTMRRGRLSLLGRRLTFTRGNLGFTGSLVPTLDMAAESSASDATITVAVTGPANNPKFSFTSVPALPEDEVLARLIFGQAMGNLSPLQIARLAGAAAELAGAGGTTGLLSSLREKLGVDDLDVKSNEDGSTAVSVGKYLNDKTYLTIETGDKAGSGKAAIDLDVGRGVKLRGEAYGDGQAKGGIFFEREY